MQTNNLAYAPDTAKRLARWLLTVFYAVAGLLHLSAPERFLPIMPEMVPWPIAVILATGLCEIAGAIALHIPRLQRLAGWMLALYALAVWPANFKHALDGIAVPGLPTSWWYHLPRLAAQPLLIWLPLWATAALENRKR